MQSVDRLLLSASLNLEPDLDQLNHILGVLGSPTQEDLMCIINDKVSLVWWSSLTRMTSCVSPLTRCTGANTRLKVSCLLHRWRRSCIWYVSKFYRQPRKILGMFLRRKKEICKTPQWWSFLKYCLSDFKKHFVLYPVSFADSYRFKGHWTYLKVTAHSCRCQWHEMYLKVTVAFIIWNMQMGCLVSFCLITKLCRLIFYK